MSKIKQDPSLNATTLAELQSLRAENEQLRRASLSQGNNKNTLFARSFNDRSLWPLNSTLGGSCIDLPNVDVPAFDQMKRLVGNFSRSNEVNITVANNGENFGTPGKLTYIFVCPIGHYCSHHNVEISMCLKGHMCPYEGMIKPIPCPAGTYQPETRGLTCFPCPRGTYCPNPKTVEPSLCEAGYTCDINTQSEGKIYNNVGGKAMNAFIDFGLTFQSHCPAGSYCPVGNGISETSFNNVEECPRNFPDTACKKSCNAKFNTPCNCDNEFYCIEGTSSSLKDAIPQQFTKGKQNVCYAGFNCPPASKKPQGQSECALGFYCPGYHSFYKETFPPLRCPRGNKCGERRIAKWYRMWFQQGKEELEELKEIENQRKKRRGKSQVASLAKKDVKVADNDESSAFVKNKTLTMLVDDNVLDAFRNDIEAVYGLPTGLTPTEMAMRINEKGNIIKNALKTRTTQLESTTEVTDVKGLQSFEARYEEKSNTTSINKTVDNVNYMSFEDPKKIVKGRGVRDQTKGGVKSSRRGSVQWDNMETLKDSQLKSNDVDLDFNDHANIHSSESNPIQQLSSWVPQEFYDVRFIYGKPRNISKGRGGK